MLKKHVFALLILLGSTTITTAQDQDKAILDEGLVVLKIHDPTTTTSIVTDSKGQFVFTRYDLKGQPFRTLWKLDDSAKEWKEAENSAESGDLLLVAGKTDLNAVPPGSMVQAVYWEDASGAAWCLANPGTNPLDPILIQDLHSGDPPVLDMNRNSDDKGWMGKFPIRLQFK